MATTPCINKSYACVVRDVPHNLKVTATCIIFCTVLLPFDLKFKTTKTYHDGKCENFDIANGSIYHLFEIIKSRSLHVIHFEFSKVIG